MTRDPGNMRRYRGRVREPRRRAPATTIIASSPTRFPNLFAQENSVITPVMPTYGRWDVAVDRGEGCYLYATDGRKFLDFTSGIAVTALGHCHPHLVEAVTEQARRLWHVSNLFHIPGQERLAERLVDNSFADTVFFSNSGAEAVRVGAQGRAQIPARDRPSRALPRHRLRRLVPRPHLCHPRRRRQREPISKGFGPPMDGFDHVAFGNLNEMRAAIGAETAAIIVEPVQGEGGVRAALGRLSAGAARDLRRVRPAAGL